MGDEFVQGQVLLGKISDSNLERIDQLGLYREPNTGILIPKGTTINPSDVPGINQSISKGQQLGYGFSGLTYEINPDKYAQQKALLDKGLASGNLYSPTNTNALKNAPSNAIGSAPGGNYLAKINGNVVVIDKTGKVQSNPSQYSYQAKNLPYQTRGTEIKSAPTTKTEVYLEPTLLRRPTGKFITDSETGRKIPTYSEVRYFDPKGKDLGNGAYQSTERSATLEEAKYYKEQTSVVQASSVPAPSKIQRSLVESYNVLSTDVYQANIGSSEFLDSVGLSDKNLEKVGDVFSYTTPLSLLPGGREFISGAISAPLKDIKNKPFNNAGLFALGAGLGYLVEGAPLVLKEAGYLINSGTGKFLYTTTKVSTTGAGLYLGGSYVISKAGEIVLAPTAKQRGEIFGTASKDASLFGFGYSKGVKGAQMTQGFLSTLGRTEVPFEKITTPNIISGQDTFLLLPKNQQLKAFKEGRYALPGERPGAFHSTPERFWQDVITPQSGSSELPGLYGAPGISPQFLKLQGSKSGLSFNFQNYFKNITTGSKPGVAYLIPKGFRLSPYIETKPYELEGNTFKYRFKKPAKEGYADVPLMKNEAETIFRKEAGDYSLVKKKFYTTINGIKIPIDTFESINLKNQPTKPTGKLFKSSNYNYPTSENVYPESLGYNVKKDFDISISTSKPSSVKSKMSKSIYSELDTSYKPSSSKKSSTSFSFISNTSYSITPSSSSSLSKTSSSISSYVKSSNLPSSIIRSNRSKTSGGGGSNSYITTPPRNPFDFTSKKTKPSLKSKPYNFNFPNIIIEQRRYGKFKPVGRARTAQQAFDIGAELTRENLGATFRLRGVKGNQNFNIDNNIFRLPKNPGKEAPFTFIQRRGQRLSSFGEKAEIQLAKQIQK